MVQERTGRTVSAMKLYYAGESDSNPYVPFTHETLNITQTIAEVDQVVQHIERNNFKQTQGEKCDCLCGNCDFRFHCNPGKSE